MGIPAAAYIEIHGKAQRGEIDGQEKAPPKYWITTTCGGSGYFAVMMWDGMGFDEPWDTGIGRYRTRRQAEIEAREWAASEELEYQE